MTDIYPPHGSSPNLPYASHAIYQPNLTNIMPISQSLTPTSNNQTSPTPIGHLTALGNIQNLTQTGFKTENDNQMATPPSPGSQQQIYSSNLPPTPNSMITILGPNSGECKKNLGRFQRPIAPNLVLMSLSYFSLFLFVSGNSNGNESPCSNEMNTNNNNIQQMNNWGVSSAHLSRNSSPVAISSSLGQLGQPLGVHGQSLGSFGQNGIHNSGIHSYPGHGSPKPFGHQPFYGWY